MFSQLSRQPKYLQNEISCMTFCVILLYVYTFCLIYLFILVSYLSVFGGNICFLCLVIQISCILEISPRFSIALLNVEPLDLKSNILYNFFCDFVLLYVLLQCMSILVVVIKNKKKTSYHPCTIHVSAARKQRLRKQRQKSLLNQKATRVVVFGTLRYFFNAISGA